jgi:hypothetical protein
MKLTKEMTLEVRDQYMGQLEQLRFKILQSKPLTEGEQHLTSQMPERAYGEIKSQWFYLSSKAEETSS